MKVLLTGASGFLGSIFYEELKNDFEIITIGRSSSNNIQADLSIQIPTLNHIETLIHAAGKAHIYPKTEQEIQAFFEVNVQGTKNLLQALANNPVKQFVFISSVSVYGLSTGENITEDFPLNGNSPYAKSKIECEKLIIDWCNQNQCNYLILRLPLIVGKNPKGNLQKMMNAIQKGTYVRIAKGTAKKSAVLATDVAQLINQWIVNPAPSGIYNLTDGYHPNFYEIEEALKKQFHKKRILSIPNWIATLLGKVGDQFTFFPVNTQTIKKITQTFTFSDEKAKNELNWQANKVV